MNWICVIFFDTWYNCLSKVQWLTVLLARILCWSKMDKTNSPKFPAPPNYIRLYPARPLRSALLRANGMNVDVKSTRGTSGSHQQKCFSRGRTGSHSNSDTRSNDDVPLDEAASKNIIRFGWLYQFLNLLSSILCVSFYYNLFIFYSSFFNILEHA